MKELMVINRDRPSPLDIDRYINQYQRIKGILIQYPNHY